MANLSESLLEIVGNHRLVIFDLNGVLDQQTGIKKLLLLNYLGHSHSDDVDKVLVTIERLYDQDKSISLSRAIQQAMEYHHLPISPESADKLAQSYLDNNSLDTELWQKVVKLADTKSVAVYTSLKIANLPTKISANLKSHKDLIRLFDSDFFQERKPSISNLLQICQSFGVDPRQAVMIGDNVAVDLMPAKLLGMTTVLVSDYTDVLTNRSMNR